MQIYRSDWQYFYVIFANAFGILLYQGFFVFMFEPSLVLGWRHLGGAFELLDEIGQIIESGLYAE